LPVAGKAVDADANENVIFTESQPGHWAKAVGSHVPQASVVNGKVTIKTPHPMSEEHYIVSHSVVLWQRHLCQPQDFLTQRRTGIRTCAAGWL
jgi:hypothetical protein